MRFRVFYPIEIGSGIFKTNVIDAENENEAHALLESCFPKQTFMVDESLGYWHFQFAGLYEGWVKFTQTSKEYRRLIEDITPELNEKHRAIIEKATSYLAKSEVTK